MFSYTVYTVDKFHIQWCLYPMVDLWNTMNEWMNEWMKEEDKEEQKRGNEDARLINMNLNMKLQNTVWRKLFKKI